MRTIALGLVAIGRPGLSKPSCVNLSIPLLPSPIDFLTSVSNDRAGLTIPKLPFLPFRLALPLQSSYPLSLAAFLIQKPHTPMLRRLAPPQCADSCWFLTQIPRVHPSTTRFASPVYKTIGQRCAMCFTLLKSGVSFAGPTDPSSVRSRFNTLSRSFVLVSPSTSNCTTV